MRSGITNSPAPTRQLAKASVAKNAVEAAGAYKVFWDGRDQTGKHVASGVYFYKLNAGSFTQTKKMVLLK